jgi:hypothetical protein
MRRSLLTSGGLAKMIAQGVRGMTSNPTIFEKAIVSSGDYEDALRKLVAEGRSTIEIYEQLAIDDIRGACDLMLPLFKESGGVDGRISLEVLPELATATDKTVAEGLAPGRRGGPAQRDDQGAGHARRDPGDPRADRTRRERERDADLLAAAVRGGRRGVPGRPGGSRRRRRQAGRPRVGGQLLRVARRQRVRQAAEGEGRGVARSGARCEALLGKLAIGNAKMAYEIYERTIASPRWGKLAARARGRSACCGRRPAPRIRATPTPITWRR